jgi:LysM repeat protein
MIILSLREPEFSNADFLSEQAVLSCAAMGSVRQSNWKGFLPYLGINVLVSAITVVIVISLLGGGERGAAIEATPTVDVIGQVDEQIPTVTPTKVPSPTPVTYTVQAGDTLLQIATEFGLSVDALMAANRLKDPNALSAGQLLILPIDTATENSSQGTGTSQSTPTETSDVAPSVVINAVEGAGDLEIESIRLLNSGGQVSMAGWALDDGEGNRFVFPAFTFYSTGAVDVHTRGGTNTSIDLFWGLSQPIWVSGKQVQLRDSNGGLQSTFQIP